MKINRILIAAIAAISFTSAAMAAAGPTTTTATTTTATSSTSTDLTFLTSRKFLLAYAVQQVTTANLSVDCSSQVGNQTTMWSTSLSAGHTSRDILAVYAGQTKPLTVINPQDYVYTDAWVTDSDGYPWFYGFSSTQAILGKGGYSLPAMPLTLNLTTWATVKFAKNVAYAELLYVDPTTGQTYNERQLNGDGNKIYFPSDAAGQVLLIVNYTDGTQSNYDLRSSGAPTNGTQLVQTISSTSIANLVSYLNPTAIVDQIPSQNGVGNNRTYEVIIKSSGSVTPGTTIGQVSFSVKTSDGLIPRGVWIQGGNTPWTYIQWNGNADLIYFSLPNGIWYIVPDWDPAQFREPAPQIDNGGGVG